LGEIINVLLEIAKIESGQEVQKQPLRLDELIFDVIEELNTVYPNFYFEVNYTPDEINESSLIIKANRMLMKQAFQNMLTNCIAYSSNQRAEIKIDCTSKNLLTIYISNFGPIVSKEEDQSLFTQFFRGKNSQKKMGFGLGLVLTKKILALYSGRIVYSTPNLNLNVFELRFLLS